MPPLIARSTCQIDNCFVLCANVCTAILAMQFPHNLVSGRYVCKFPGSSEHVWKLPETANRYWLWIVHDKYMDANIVTRHWERVFDFHWLALVLKLVSSCLLSHQNVSVSFLEQQRHHIYVLHLMGNTGNTCGHSWESDLNCWEPEFPPPIVVRNLTNNRLADLPTHGGRCKRCLHIKKYKSFLEVRIASSAAYLLLLNLIDNCSRSHNCTWSRIQLQFSIFDDIQLTANDFLLIDNCIEI